MLFVYSFVVPSLTILIIGSILADRRHLIFYFVHISPLVYHSLGSVRVSLQTSSRIGLED
ncbi:CMF_HP2_G0012170.mRNA.1.CDS.1 [Saccharomyces cerevisiae]|nr:CMF_HP2_G0012170.mRNA.1.CDS.1 [Saccharomyces cerevisiae]CAI6443284.1 CMF_HP2_G0012170.mRNA.1.CDS.1 [Saccharomyces cerevisiae]